ERVRPGPGRFDGEALEAQGHGHHVDDVGLVVDHQNAVSICQIAHMTSIGDLAGNSLRTCWIAGPGNLRDPDIVTPEESPEMQVTAAVLEEHHKHLNVQELEIDEPLAGEVLVKIVASGVCHTDAIAQ